MWLIGIDDTDMPDTRGTGRLARMVLADLVARGAVEHGVTRHQLLVHPSVPYTSHNSSACLAIDAPDGQDTFDHVCRFVADQSPAGSDPGVCVADAGAVSDVVMAFGRRAQCELLTRGEAEALAADENLLLAGLAGTRDGMIGALAAAGLRAGGADGRFIGLGTIRELADNVQVRDLLDAGIDAVENHHGVQLPPHDRVATLGWARPRLLGGRAVLLVERSDNDGVDWIVADRRRHGKAPDNGTGSQP